MIRLPWTVVRRTDLDELYDVARAAGVESAERLVGTLAESVEAGDLYGIRLLYPVIVQALADERARTVDGPR